MAHSRHDGAGVKDDDGAVVEEDGRGAAEAASARGTWPRRRDRGRRRRGRRGGRPRGAVKTPEPEMTNPWPLHETPSGKTTNVN